jgi:hypothetical protein
MYSLLSGVCTLRTLFDFADLHTLIFRRNCPTFRTAVHVCMRQIESGRPHRMHAKKDWLFQNLAIRC